MRQHFNEAVEGDDGALSKTFRRKIEHVINRC